MERTTYFFENATQIPFMVRQAHHERVPDLIHERDPDLIHEPEPGLTDDRERDRRQLFQKFFIR
jgi:hypothetical protein